MINFQAYIHNGNWFISAFLLYIACIMDCRIVLFLTFSYLATSRSLNERNPDNDTLLGWLAVEKDNAKYLLREL